ncbi:hypothetical protein N9L68_05240, partial [bacterium]|nr:hypothetical protein [bacterium]
HGGGSPRELSPDEVPSAWTSVGGRSRESGVPHAGDDSAEHWSSARRARPGGGLAPGCSAQPFGAADLAAQGYASDGGGSRDGPWSPHCCLAPREWRLCRFAGACGAAPEHASWAPTGGACRTAAEADARASPSGASAVAVEAGIGDEEVDGAPRTWSSGGRAWRRRWGRSVRPPEAEQAGVSCWLACGRGSRSVGAPEAHRGFGEQQGYETCGLADPNIELRLVPQACGSSRLASGRGSRSWIAAEKSHCGIGGQVAYETRGLADPKTELRLAPQQNLTSVTLAQVEARSDVDNFIENKN